MIRWAVGDAYVGLGQPGKALRHLDRAWQVSAADPEFGPGHRETLWGMHKLIAAYWSAGRPEVGLPLAKTAVGLAFAHRPTTAAS